MKPPVGFVGPVLPRCGRLLGRRCLAAALSLAPALPVYAATSGTLAFDPDRYLSHIKFLASPDLRGRESGSPELEKAAQYIAGQFRADGLKPVDGKSFEQPFEITTNAKMGTGNRFEFTVGSERETLQPGKEF